MKIHKPPICLLMRSEKKENDVTDEHAEYISDEIRTLTKQKWLQILYIK